MDEADSKTADRPPVSGEPRAAEAIDDGRGWVIPVDEPGVWYISRYPVGKLAEATSRADAPPPPLDVLADAIHHAMCDVSHHDSMTRCKNQRKYELVAESVHRRLKEHPNG